MEVEQQKIGILDQFLYAVSKPKQYRVLIERKTTTIILYTVIMALILTVMSFIIPVSGWLLSYGGIDGFIEEQIPAFHFEDGKLSVDGIIDMKSEGISQILIDTSKETVTKKDIDREYMQQVLVSKNNLIVSSFNGMTQEISFDQLKNLEFDKNSLLKLVPTFYVSLMVAVVLQFFIVAIQYVIGAFFYGLMGMVYCGLDGGTIKFAEAFKAAIYGKTLAAVVGAFNMVIGSPIPASIWGFSSFLLTLFFIVIGLRSKKGTKNAFMQS